MKVVDILNLFKSWDVGLLLNVARDAHVQHRQNQVLKALLNLDLSRTCLQMSL